MNLRAQFSMERFKGIVLKEFIQMRRDRLTFAMMIGIPLIQLILFGYAINVNPRHLPADVIMGDNGPQARSILHAFKNTSYFDFNQLLKNDNEGLEALARGDAQFVISIPENFSRDLIRGDRPTILVEADATDPSATGYALSSLSGLLSSALHDDLKGSLSYLNAADPPFNLQVHPLYNPEINTQYNIVPGLMGVILTMTMIMITGLAITRERERGTMENLLSMPTRPLEVLVGKIVPYILVGYVQLALILFMAYFLFGVPIHGSILLLTAAAFVFIAANLALGIMFSSIAQNQLQAMQMAFFIFLPSILLSGYLFPFRGMPRWAQGVGEILPLTHFIRIARGILLKGNGFWEIAPEIWPIALFAIVALIIGVKRYHQTLD